MVPIYLSMSQGSVVNAITSLSTSATYDIQPESGDTWSIHNIQYANDISVSIYDGTHLLTFLSFSGSGIIANLYIGVSNTVWIRITNTSADTALYAFDGVVMST